MKQDEYIIDKTRELQENKRFVLELSKGHMFTSNNDNLTFMTQNSVFLLALRTGQTRIAVNDSLNIDQWYLANSLTRSIFLLQILHSYDEYNVIFPHFTCHDTKNVWDHLHKVWDFFVFCGL